MTRDDPRDPIPDPDDPITDVERARARSFAGLVDHLLSGKPMPPALPSDERALIEVATTVHACTAEADLEPDRIRAIVDDAFTGGPSGERAGSEPARVVRAAPSGRWRRLAPWAAATIAAAAALVLALVRPAPPPRYAGPITQTPLPRALRSRPADALVGAIPRDRAGDASARLDAVYADRMAGYRSLRLRTPGGRP
jgi:hypothetical protein